jgi:hypothetical protein
MRTRWRDGTTLGVCYIAVVKKWNGSLPGQAAFRYGAWALALVYAWWFFRWSVRGDHFFFADDWDWFRRAEFFTLKQQWSLLPQYYLNDRPVGALIIRALYRTFGLNPAPSNWLCLGLHLANMTLLLALARRLIRSWWVAAATALAYGTWSAALRGVSWFADIFDLLGLTQILLTMLASPRGAGGSAYAASFSTSWRCAPKRRQSGCPRCCWCTYWFRTRRAIGCEKRQGGCGRISCCRCCFSRCMRR